LVEVYGRFRGACDNQITRRHIAEESDGALGDLRSSGMLRVVDWQLITDVSGHPIDPIFKGQAVQEEFLDCS